ncbi:uncharacterized protein LOC144170296 isoform X2 [Haemaphysalis longicornis]
MQGAGRKKLIELNPHLTCVLCGGYFVDATTIIECLHSFCKTCIVRYLDVHKMCPVCDVQVHKARPLQNIRSDQTLQDIVYKLVPGLFKNEMRRRREFYASLPASERASRWPTSSEGRGDVRGLERLIFNPEDLISISLEYTARDVLPIRPLLLGPQPEAQETPPGGRRYLLCPGGFTVGHLKKFLRAKFGLGKNHEVDVMYMHDHLLDEYSLVDLAYIYSWRRSGPMRLLYRFPELPPFLVGPGSKEDDMVPVPPDEGKSIVITAVASQKTTGLPGDTVLASKKVAPCTDSNAVLTSVGPPSVGPPSVGPPSVGPPSVGPPSVGPPSVSPRSINPVIATPNAASRTNTTHSNTNSSDVGRANSNRADAARTNPPSPSIVKKDSPTAVRKPGALSLPGQPSAANHAGLSVKPLGDKRPEQAGTKQSAVRQAGNVVSTPPALRPHSVKLPATAPSPPCTPSPPSAAGVRPSVEQRVPSSVAGANRTAAWPGRTPSSGSPPTSRPVTGSPRSAGSKLSLFSKATPVTPPRKNGLSPANGVHGNLRLILPAPAKANGVKDSSEPPAKVAKTSHHHHHHNHRPNDGSGDATKRPHLDSRPGKEAAVS